MLYKGYRELPLLVKIVKQNFCFFFVSIYNTRKTQRFAVKTNGRPFTHVDRYNVNTSSSRHLPTVNANNTVRRYCRCFASAHPTWKRRIITEPFAFYSPDEENRAGRQHAERRRRGGVFVHLQTRARTCNVRSGDTVVAERRTRNRGESVRTTMRRR